MLELILTLLLSKPVIVTWSAVGMRMTSCIQTPYPYTGEIPSGVPAVACYEPFTVEKSRRFDSLAEAASFVANAPHCQANVTHPSLGFGSCTHSWSWKLGTEE